MAAIASIETNVAGAFAAAISTLSTRFSILLGFIGPIGMVAGCTMLTLETLSRSSALDMRARCRFSW